MRPREFYSYAAALLTLCLWASSFVGIRVALETWTPGGLAFLRYVVAAVSLLILFPFLDTGDRLRVGWRDISIFTSFALLGVVGYHVGLNIGEKTVTAGTASFIVSQIPLVTLALNAALFGERITLRGAVGLALGIAGTGIILLGESGSLTLEFGVLWILMAITSESLYFIYQKHMLSRFTPFGINFYTTLFAVVLMVPFTFDLTVPEGSVDAASIAVVVYLGVFPAAVAYLSWTYAIKELGVSRTATTLYALPIITILIGFIVIGEFPSWFAIGGGLLALFGAYVSSRSRSEVVPKPA